MLDRGIDIQLRCPVTPDTIGKEPRFAAASGASDEEAVSTDIALRLCPILQLFLGPVVSEYVKTLLVTDQLCLPLGNIQRFEQEPESIKRLCGEAKKKNIFEVSLALFLSFFSLSFHMFPFFFFPSFQSFFFFFFFFLDPKLNTRILFFFFFVLVLSLRYSLYLDSDFLLPLPFNFANIIFSQ